MWRALSACNHRGKSYPLPVEHFRFHPVRRWAFDIAWPEHKVALEIEGGAFTGGRHTQGAGYTQDCEKYNAATFLGWSIIRITSPMLRGEPVPIFEQIADLLKSRIPLDPRPDDGLEYPRDKQAPATRTAGALLVAVGDAPHLNRRLPPFSFLPQEAQ